MNSNQDIRWIQRLNSFDTALSQLTHIVLESKKRTLNEIEQQGLVKAFEYNYELAWNCLKDYFFDQGYTEITGPKDAFRHAYKLNLIQDGSIWMEMIRSRNQTSHIYNRSVADLIADKILHIYYPQFLKLSQTLKQLKKSDDDGKK